MIDDPLAQVLMLLAAAVAVVWGARRLGLPTILGYLAVGLLLGPHALGLIGETKTTTLLAELGVVFLLFTLGLEFSWPRMVAMRREVFGIGSAQVVLTATVIALIGIAFGLEILPAIVIGGALSWLHPLLAVGWAAGMLSYATLNLLFAFRGAAKDSASMWRISVAFLTIHVAWGCGFLYGLGSKAVRRAGKTGAG